MIEIHDQSAVRLVRNPKDLHQGEISSAIVSKNSNCLIGALVIGNRQIETAIAVNIARADAIRSDAGAQGG